MSPLPIRFAAFLALMLVPVWASGQSSSFRDVALRVNLGDELKIDDGSGTTTSGRLRTLSASDITVDTATGERRFTFNIQGLAVRHRQTRKAVLIGAGLGAATGLVLACTAEEKEECGDAGLILGAVGAGAGALVARIRPGWVPVLGAGARSPENAAAGAPGPLDELALGADLGDQVKVRTRSGTTVRGRLVQLTGDALSVRTSSGDTRVDAADLERVATRHFAVGTGALVGAGLFTAFAYAARSCRDNPDCMPLIAAPYGAGVGAAIGALIPRWKTVFPTRQRDVALLPFFRANAAGVRMAMRW